MPPRAGARGFRTTIRGPQDEGTLPPENGCLPPEHYNPDLSVPDGIMSVAVARGLQAQFLQPIQDSPGRMASREHCSLRPRHPRLPPRFIMREVPALKHVAHVGEPSVVCVVHPGCLPAVMSLSLCASVPSCSSIFKTSGSRRSATDGRAGMLRISSSGNLVALDGRLTLPDSADHRRFRAHRFR